MAIRNYSTSISAERSIGEIQGLLRQVKCRGAYVRYADDGEPIGLSFQALTAWGEREYVIPADIDGVNRVLARQQRGKLATREQAVRVAWRLAKDWVSVQLAYVQAGAAVFEQTMLPYLVVAPDTTVYDWFQKQQLALPKPSED